MLCLQSYQLYYTKPLRVGRPAEWSLSQYLVLDPAGGKVTALGAMDSAVVIFQERRVSQVYGDGPNAAGVGAFQGPDLITTATGCNSPKSIVTTDQGLFLQTTRGFEMLTRAQNQGYEIGFPVDRYGKYTVVGAVAVPQYSQIRFALSQSPTGVATDLTLVFDYVLQKWSTYSAYTSTCTGYWNKNQVYVRATGNVVWYEDSSKYLDGTTPIQMTIETAWIKDAGTQGYNRARRFAILGTYVSAHQLQIEFAYDYQEYTNSVIWSPSGVAFTDQTAVYGATSPFGGDSVYGGDAQPLPPQQYQVRGRFPRQKNEAVKFRIKDLATTGESCRLSLISVEFNPKDGLNRLPTSTQGV